MFLGGGSGKKRWSLGDRMGGGMDGGYRGEGVGGGWAWRMVLATLATYHQLLIGTRRQRRLPDCKKPFSSEKNISQGGVQVFAKTRMTCFFLR